MKERENTSDGPIETSSLPLDINQVPPVVNTTPQAKTKGMNEEMLDKLFPSEIDDQADHKPEKSRNSQKKRNRIDDLDDDEYDDFSERKLKKSRGSEEDDEDEEMNSDSEERELGLDEFDDVRPTRSKRSKIQTIQTDDRVIQELIEKMDTAYREDKDANRSKQPALSKLKLLPEVLPIFHKQHTRDSYFEAGFLKQCKNWLNPLPDGTLPNLKIREGILKSLEKLDLTEDLLRASGIGRAVMTLSKHKSETLPNQKICTGLISKWSRPIFDITTTYKELEKYEKDSHLSLSSSGKKPRKRMSLSSSDPLDLASSAESLPSYTIRPQKVRMDYTIRPPRMSEDLKKEKSTPSHSKPSKIQEKISALRASKRVKMRAVSVGVNKPTRHT